MNRERGRISSEAAAGLLTLAAYLPFLLLRTLIAQPDAWEEVVYEDDPATAPISYAHPAQAI